MLPSSTVTSPVLLHRRVQLWHVQPVLPLFPVSTLLLLLLLLNHLHGATLRVEAEHGPETGVLRLRGQAVLLRFLLLFLLALFGDRDIQEAAPVARKMLWIMEVR